MCWGGIYNSFRLVTGDTRTLHFLFLEGHFVLGSWFSMLALKSSHHSSQHDNAGSSRTRWNNDRTILKNQSDPWDWYIYLNLVDYDGKCR